MGWWVVLFAIISLELFLRWLHEWTLRQFGIRPLSLLERLQISCKLAQINIASGVVLRRHVDERTVEDALAVLSKLDCFRIQYGWWGVSKGKKLRSIPLFVEQDVEDLSRHSILKRVEKELNAEFPLNEVPMRVQLLQAMDGKSSALVLTVNHTSLDGLSAWELCRRLLVLLRDPSHDFGAGDSTVASSDDFLLLPSWMARSIFVAPVLTIVELFLDLRAFTVRSHPHKVNGERAAISDSIPGGHSSRHNTQLVEVAFSKEATDALVGFAKRNGTTVGNLISAASMIALAKQQQQQQHDIWITMQADFRRMWGNQKSFVFGNLTPPLSFARDVKNILAGGILKTAQDLMVEMRSRWGPWRVMQSYISFYAFLGKSGLEAVASITRRTGNTHVSVPVATISNLGKLELYDDPTFPICGDILDSVGGATQPVCWPHHIIFSRSLNSSLQLVSSSSRFALTRQEATLFLKAVSTLLLESIGTATDRLDVDEHVIATPG